MIRRSASTLRLPTPCGAQPQCRLHPGLAITGHNGPSSTAGRRSCPRRGGTNRHRFVRPGWRVRGLPRDGRRDREWTAYRRVGILGSEQRINVASVKDGIETRERLLRAAVNLYSAKGFSGASVEDICRRARVTKGAFYHHFESKAHLIMAIHNGFVDLQIAEITAVIEKDLPPEETLAEAIVVIIRNILNQKASISLFMREYPAMPRDVDRAVRDSRLKYEQLLVGVIDRGRDLGVFHTELPTNILLYGILGMGAWATQWYDPKRAPAPKVIGRNYARMVIDGLTTPTAS